MANRRFLGSLLAVGLGSLVGCSSAPPKKEAEAPSTRQPDPPPAPDWDESMEPKEPEPNYEKAAPGLKSENGGDGSTADVYDISIADCRLLGRKYADVTRADQAEKLDAKLTDAQRSQALENIDRVAEKLETRWFDGCKESLVGKSTEYGSIKCAVHSTTVEAFDACLNGPAK